MYILLHWKLFFLNTHLYLTQLLFKAGTDLYVVTSDLHGNSIG